MKTIGISIIVAVIFIGGAFILAKNGGGDNGSKNGGYTVEENANNVSVVDGKQIVLIKAKGGYQPRVSYAKAGLPTILRFSTGGTFDCSSAVRIPSLGITKMLPQTGSTDIDIGSSGIVTLKGSCGMGMYPFEVEFRG